MTFHGLPCPSADFQDLPWPSMAVAAGATTATHHPSSLHTPYFLPRPPRSLLYSPYRPYSRTCHGRCSQSPNLTKRASSRPSRQVRPCIQIASQHSDTCMLMVWSIRSTVRQRHRRADTQKLSPTAHLPPLPTFAHCPPSPTAHLRPLPTFPHCLASPTAHLRQLLLHLSHVRFHSLQAVAPSISAPA